MPLADGERGRVGTKYTDPQQLWLALDAGGGSGTLLLRASWMKQQRVEHGFRIPKRGDELPAEAIITVAELREITKKSRCMYGALPVIALSHFWRTKEHPDPDGETAKLVIASLNPMSGPVTSIEYACAVFFLSYLVKEARELLDAGFVDWM